MTTLNINRKVDDPFYRYKMPKLIAKVEGRGNGIKTVIPNMVEIAKSLARPSTYTTKYFGCELGAQTSWDEQAERYIVNGAHQDSDLQNLLDGFIEKFVLCPECSNPETKLKVSNSKRIEQTCAACGYRGNLKTTHRLVTFILNHPPEGEKKISSGKGKKKAAKNAEEDEEDAAGTVSPNTNGGATAAIAHSNMAQRGGGGEVDAPEVREVDEEDWSEDTSAEAVRAREGQNLTGTVSKLVMANDAEKTIEEKLEIFHTSVLKSRDQKTFPAKDVLALAERLDCKEKGVMVLVELIVEDASVNNFIANLKRHQALLQRFTDGSKKTQKYLLHAVEKSVEKHRATLLKHVAVIFKALYDLDIVDEAAFLSWGEKVSSKYIKNKDVAQQFHDNAKPFLTWLAEAEEEDDEEGDDEEGEGGEDEVNEADEDGLTVAFDSGAAGVIVDDEKTKTVVASLPEGGAAKTAAASSSSSAAAAKPEKDDEDINIDDI